MKKYNINLSSVQEQSEPVFTSKTVKKISFLEKSKQSELKLQAYLNEHGQSASFVDDEGNTLLHLACLIGDSRHILAEQLLRSSTSLVCSKNEDGDTPLHYALQSGHDAEKIIVTLLNTRLVRPNVVNDWGETVINSALIGEINNPYVLAKQLQRVIEYFNINYDYTGINIKNIQNISALHNAAIVGFPSIVQALVTAKDIDFGIIDSGGRTPLHVCSTRIIFHSHYLTLQTLYNAGGKNFLNYEDIDGVTPLNLIMSNASLEQLVLLDFKYIDILTLAHKYHSKNIVKELVESNGIAPQELFNEFRPLMSIYEKLCDICQENTFCNLNKVTKYIGFNKRLCLSDEVIFNTQGALNSFKDGKELLNTYLQPNIINFIADEQKQEFLNQINNMPEIWVDIKNSILDSDLISAMIIELSGANSSND